VTIKNTDITSKVQAMFARI